MEYAKSIAGAENVKHEYKTVFKGFSAKLNIDQLLLVRQNSFVEYVEADQVVSTSACIAESAGSWGQTRVAQHAIDLTNLPYKAASNSAKDVTAYVLDTGIYVDHSEFQGRATFGFKAEPSWTNTDVHGHGTHVASTIGGRIYGVTKKVNLVAVKVLGDDGFGSNAGVIAGIDYTASQHVSKGKPSTANMSLGGSKSTAINNAVASAVSLGVVFVVAAGNDDDNACNYSPASAPSAVTVGATDIGLNPSNEEIDIRSYFSNYGSCVDIFAPGSLIKGAWIGSKTATKVISGTSMACPHVCGLASLILGDIPSLSPGQVKDRLVANGNQKMIDLICTDEVCKQSPNVLAYNGC